MATKDQTSPLLALPVELVGRIVDSLEPESLLMLRLTCKVLDHSTHDLFAKKFFERRYCCIYYEPRWLLLNEVISSRLGSRVRKVEFTSEPLESKWYKDLQLAPHASESDMTAAQSSAGGQLSRSIGPQTQVPAWPSTAIFHRVFRDIKRLVPATLVKLDFLEDWLRETDLTAPLIKVDVLIAAVTAGVTIASLNLDVQDAHSFTSALTHLEPEIASSTRSLKRLRFRKRGHDHEPQFITSILESANDIRELAVASLPGLPMTTAVLRAHDFSKFTTLRLSGAIFPGEDLVTGLSACRSMLHLRLSDVRLLSGEDGWPSVFHALASLPQLHKLSLSVLWDRFGAIRDRRLTFRGLLHGKTTFEGRKVEYEGREQTVAGLDELKAAPWLREVDNRTYFIAFNRADGCRICKRGTE